MRLLSQKLEWMKTLAGLIELFGPSRASEAHTHRGQLQLKASDLGHCAVYETELQRFWPITEENRKAKIAEFAEKHGFRLAYYKQGHCAISFGSPTSRPQRFFTRSRRAACVWFLEESSTVPWGTSLDAQAAFWPKGVRRPPPYAQLATRFRNHN